ATSNPAYLHITTNDPPTVTITMPSNGTLYSAGDTIAYDGTGSAPQDGTLAASAYSWTIVLHPGTHTHPFLRPINSVTSGSSATHTIATPATDTNYTATYNAQAGIYGPTTFSNTAAITIPDHGIANPYPSAINVNGLSGVVSKVTVTVNNFSHTYPHDVGW